MYLFLDKFRNLYFGVGVTHGFREIERWRNQSAKVICAFIGDHSLASFRFERIID